MLRRAVTTLLKSSNYRLIQRTSQNFFTINKKLTMNKYLCLPYPKSFTSNVEGPDFIKNLQKNEDWDDHFVKVSETMPLVVQFYTK